MALKGVNEDELGDMVAWAHFLRMDMTLTPLLDRTGGPARYVRVAETGGRLGFITPLTHNFCEGCNRVRLTCTGKLYLCLGQEDAADLRAPFAKLSLALARREVRQSRFRTGTRRPACTPSRR